MTTTKLQPPPRPTTSDASRPSTKIRGITASMAWSTEKLRFSCSDSIGLKQLWKLLALDGSNGTKSSNQQCHHMAENLNKTHQMGLNNKDYGDQCRYNLNTEKNNVENCENIAEYLTNRGDIVSPTHMSLLKFLAINALELSAPATPALLQQQNQPNTSKYSQQNVKPDGWMQLSGHPESIVPTSTGIVRKRVNSFSDSEVLAYQQLSQETLTFKIVPQFFGTLQLSCNEKFIQLQDLLSGFKDPCVMDIKMGCRTFLESEVTNTTLRPDLYQKMIAVDPYAPTMEEHNAGAVTKLRYMLFREEMSSSHSKGFRIEALRLRGRKPVNDLKTVKTNEQIYQIIEQFVGDKRTVHKDLIKRLKHIRSVIEKAEFFKRHEIVGSSIFIVYDDDKMNAWLIDFAKSRALPFNISVTHRAEWVPGNREEGLLKGMDELIHSFETVYSRCNTGRRCLQI